MKHSSIFTTLFALLHHLHAAHSTAPWPLDGSLFPNPIFDQVACHRHIGVNSSVCDADNILTLSDSDRVQAAINDIFKLLDECDESYEVGVAVVEQLDIPSGVTSDEAIERFARSVHDSWGVGAVECNSGILFALSTVDRVFFFSTGDGTRDIITQSRVNNMNSMIEDFGDGKFGEGTVQAMLNIQSLLIEGPESPNNADLILGIIFGVLGGVLCCIFCGAVISGVLSGNRRVKFLAHKRRIIDEYRHKNLRCKNASNKVCPVCLNEFKSGSSDGRAAEQCGHYFHEGCMEGQKSCPICRKMELAKWSKFEDPETNVKFQYLSKKYPTYLPYSSIGYYSALSFLQSSSLDPAGCAPICRDNYVPPQPSTSYHNTSSGFSGGGFGGGSSSGGAGGHF